MPTIQRVVKRVTTNSEGVPQVKRMKIGVKQTVSGAPDFDELLNARTCPIHCDMFA
jgi:hypothetical protein